MKHSERTERVDQPNVRDLDLVQEEVVPLRPLLHGRVPLEHPSHGFPVLLLVHNLAEGPRENNTCAQRRLRVIPRLFVIAPVNLSLTERERHSRRTSSVDERRVHPRVVEVQVTCGVLAAVTFGEGLRLSEGSAREVNGGGGV